MSSVRKAYETKMKTMRTSSIPVHMHFNDAASAHVHMNSDTKNPEGKSICPSVEVKPRTPWIPPGKNSTWEQSQKWEMSCRRSLTFSSFQQHSSKICPPRAYAPELEFSQSKPVTVDDLLSTEHEDEESLDGCISQYEMVDGLQTEEGALKNTVEQQKQQLEEQEEKLAHVTEKLQQSQQKNRQLRMSMKKLEEVDGRRNDDALLRKPEQVKVNVNGEEAAKEVSTEDIQSKLMCLQAKLQEKEQEETRWGELLEVEKDKAMTSFNKSVSLETTRAHLQRQLLSREAENSRLNVQIKNLEREAAQHKAAMENLRQQLSSDRQALKLATTAYKRKAERREKAAALLNIELQKMEKQAVEAVSTAESWESQCTKTAQEKKKLEADLSLLSSRVEELKVQLNSTEERSRAVKEKLVDKLHVTSESSPAEMKNYSLQIQLQEAQEKERFQEMLIADLRSNMTELIEKEEGQSSYIELSRQKNKLQKEENLQLQQEVETLERKLKKSCIQSNGLLDLHCKQEESRECSVPSTKLQEAQSDLHLQVRGASTASASVLSNLCSTESRERTTGREPSTVDKILDLETKLIQATSETNQLKKVEDQYQSQVQDVKDKLEESYSSNRILQNYIQHLKASYVHMFMPMSDVATPTTYE